MLTQEVIGVIFSDTTSSTATPKYFALEFDWDQAMIQRKFWQST